MIILGIDTSCDDTSCACIDGKKILSNIVFSQLFHSKYGGIVPELAARDHIKNITVVFNEAIKEVGIKNIEGIGVTYGPGLIGSLVVGLSFAKSLSFSLNIPFYAVNHIEAHIFSLFIENEIPFPFISLIISGGHTELILVNDFGKYKRLGSTLDDAVGESFDKVAKLLGYSYPGGPIIEMLARNGENNIKFPMPKVSDYNFSFSGLKTAVLYYLRKNINAKKDDVACSFQETVFDFLLHKVMLAVKEFNINRIGICGGVAANNRLREKFSSIDGVQVFFPSKNFCTDNGAMVALCAQYYLSKGICSKQDITACASLKLY